MKKSITMIFLLCAVTLGLAISGCGGGGGSKDSATASPVSDPAISGTATADALVDGTVTLKDSSSPVQARRTTISSDGTYTFITTGLIEPYILKAEWTDTSGSGNKMYSMAAAQPGNSQMRDDDSTTDSHRANINPLSDVIVAAAADGESPDDLFDHPDPSRYHRTSDHLEAVINSLRTVLAPLFALYQTSANPITDDDDNEDHNGNGGLRAMFHDVRIAANSGTVTVTNRQTNGLIFSGPLTNLDSGTFYPENMPGGQGSNACNYTYSTWGACQSDSTQSRTMLTSSPAGCTGTPLLTQACVSVPSTSSACTSFMYSGWGACQSDNTQARTVASSSPAGCTGGTPVLSQSCIYVAPACTYNYSTWGACQANGTQTRTAQSSPAGCTGTPILSQPCTYGSTCSSFTYNGWGTCTNGTQTRTVATSTPTGCTGGSPVLSQSCTSSTTLTLAQVTTTCTQCHGLTVNGVVLKSGGYSVSGRSASAWVSSISGMFTPPSGTTVQDFANFLTGLSSTPSTCSSFTYNGWGTCTNGTQTRTVATSTPTGCTGGTPVLSQSCTSATTCSSFTYNGWGTCTNGTQTRTVATSTPTGCTGGTPVLSQSCTSATTCSSFTYNGWGTCTNGTQTRTVATSTPTGCTGGTPVLSQSCTSSSTLTLAQVQSTCTQCHGLTVNTTVLRSGGYSASGRSASAWVSSINGMFTPPSGTTVQDFANFLVTLP